MDTSKPSNSDALAEISDWYCPISIPVRHMTTAKTNAVNRLTFFILFILASYFLFLILRYEMTAIPVDEINNPIMNGTAL